MESRRFGVCAALTTTVFLALLAMSAAVVPPRSHAESVSTDVAQDDRPWLDSSLPIGQRVELLLSRLTLEEKTQQMYGVGRPRGVHSVGYVPGVPRLGIPPLQLADGPLGVKDSCFGEIYPDNCKLGPSTALPATVSLAASFDPDLAYAYGRMIGEEARARGVDVLYGPAMNIVRVAQGGRNFEYFSEDPYLTGHLAAAWSRGLQSQDVAAQLKHYALNNQELDRHSTTSNVDEQTMREIYLPAWQIAATDGQAYSVMCANNMVNGVHNCENAYLIREILEGEWGFDGVVGSDYAATTSAIGSVNGGLDQSFTGREWGKWYDQLAELVRQGEVSEALIDERVRRILTMRFRLKMFDADRVPARPVAVERNGAFSRTVAEQGAVLLKNDRSVLPLDASSLRSIAVIGDYAAVAHPGGGGSSRVVPYYTVSPLKGIRDRVSDDVQVTTTTGGDLDQAAEVARDADVAVVIAHADQREGEDRADIDLPGDQDQLIERVHAANPRTVVVLNTGGAVRMPWVSDVHALLQMWYPGEENGNALAALLFGDADPSGRLPVTFPVNLEQDCCHSPPRYPHTDGAYEYSEQLQVGYRWYDAQRIEPLFPFGFGLSYTTFDYADLEVTPTSVTPGRAVKVSLQVTNTGPRAGTATPQVYLGFPDTVSQPPRRLVATEKVRLAPGQSERVTMTLPASALSYWNTAAHNWDVAPGTYTVFAGASSRDLPLQKTFQAHHADGAQGLTVTAPDLVAGGTTAEVSVTLNNTGSQVLATPHIGLTAPAGWDVALASPPPAVVPLHDSVRVSYRVRVPHDAGPALYVLTARARWSGLVAGSAARAISLNAIQ
ncbi:glycoside hydrolase family 3 C-terminal domain-containing protein [Actinopolymorpha sp. B11F2]|uniref:glycoside hydrolase family 3 protein n=1 Tax=Actinopolymorpha sp. B11F2 TaxID=3160862 RepID=UPI0032E4A540